MMFAKKLINNKGKTSYLILLIFLLLLTKGIYFPGGYSTNIKHEGDLVIEGSEVFEIKDCVYNQTGNIIVKDSATLLIEDAELILHQPSPHLYEIAFYNNAKLEAHNATITGTQSSEGGYYMFLYDDAEGNVTSSRFEYPACLLDARGFGDVHISDSDLDYINCGYYSNVLIKNTTTKISIRGNTDVTVFNSSQLGYITLGFGGGDKANFTLNPGYHDFWNIHINESIANLGYNITLIGSNVERWNTWSWSDADISIIDSHMYRIHCHGYSTFNFQNSYIERFVTCHDSSEATIQDSDVYYVETHNSSILKIVNSTIRDPYQVGVFEDAVIYRGWHLHVTVLSNDLPVGGAVVRAYHSENQSLVNEGITNQEGTVKLSLWENMTDAQDTYIYDNYTIEASFDWYDGNSSVSIDENKFIEIEIIKREEISDFDYIFASNNVTMIYPSSDTPKPLDCRKALVSDWLASTFIYTKLDNVTESLDVNECFVNQTIGRPIGERGSGIVSFGGPLVNPVVKYSESDETPFDDRAPIKFHDEGGIFHFQHLNGSNIPDAELPVSVINEDKDMFVIEVFKDGDGRYNMLCYGFGWKGTYAAGKYFDTQIYPNLGEYPYSWIIVKWEDSNGDGFVNTQDGGDTYTVIAKGTQ